MPRWWRGGRDQRTLNGHLNLAIENLFVHQWFCGVQAPEHKEQVSPEASWSAQAARAIATKPSQQA